MVGTTQQEVTLQRAYRTWFACRQKFASPSAFFSDELFCRYEFRPFAEHVLNQNSGAHRDDAGALKSGMETIGCGVLKAACEHAFDDFTEVARKPRDGVFDSIGSGG